MKAEDTPAVGKSVSFRPYSLYTETAAYGQAQRPQRSVSAVICEALEFFLEAKGFTRAKREIDREILAQVEKLGAATALRVLQEALNAAPGKKKLPRGGD